MTAAGAAPAGGAASAGGAAAWDELVAVALIGTDRRPVAAAAPPGAPDALGAALAARGAEDRLLASAAAWTVARRAGARVGERTDVAPAEDDPRPRCSSSAGALLRALLEDEDMRLVAEWLALAAARSLRPPPEVLPDLLDLAAPRVSLHAAVGAVAGPLGLWLAERQPRWAFVRGATDDVDTVWADGGRLERRLLIERLRLTDPAAARDLLASTFAEETWEDRVVFVDLLAIGLSDADEPFLEAALDDPRAAVRDAAAQRLAALPASRLAARMADRTRPLLQADGGTLSVTLPGAPDTATRRDGIAKGGLRSERLSALLAATPLAAWPLGFVALPIADDLTDAVQQGWAEAAKAQRDVQWARALWPLTNDGELLDVLPRDEAEALAAASPDPVRAAMALAGEWGLELSRAVIAAIRRARQGSEWGPNVASTGFHLDPAVAPEAEDLRDLGGRDLWELCDVLGIRAAMLRELS